MYNVIKISCYIHPNYRSIYQCTLQFVCHIPYQLQFYKQHISHHRHRHSSGQQYILV